MSTLPYTPAGAAPIAITSATAPSMRPVSRFFESFRLPASPRSDNRIGAAHRKHRMAAVPEFAFEDQGLEIAHRRTHRFVALAERNEFPRFEHRAR